MSGTGTGPTVRKFLSTLSLRRATRSPSVLMAAILYFYPRSPCGERPTHADFCAPKMSFLSTLSLRRATTHVIICVPERANFYPRSPCGERRAVPSRRTRARQISIHALLAESDVLQSALDILTDEFLSTLSLRRATSRHNLCPRKSKISIHALLAESDARRNAHMSRTPISIHALLAESDAETNITSIGDIEFLSTLSLRRATTSFIQTKDTPKNFYPRSPCGERLYM